MSGFTAGDRAPRDLAEDGIPVSVTYRVLKISRQPYYRWLMNPVRDQQWEEAHRLNALIDAHREDPEFGYRYLADEDEETGYPMAPRTAWRLCHFHGVASVIVRRKRGKGARPGPRFHDDLGRLTPIVFEDKMLIQALSLAA